MKILIVEPFYTGSHQRWIEGYQANSQHDIQVLSLKGRYWKWRMHGGAVTLAERFLALNFKPDLLLMTDMLDVTTFLALTRKYTANLPTVLYFHENQLTYPWSPTDQDVQKKRDNHYSFINYTSALAVDYVCFNSEYHHQSFLKELPKFLKQFPDYQGLNTVQKIKSKSHVLPLGMNLKDFDAHFTKKKVDYPLILWNHRWEYDKNPTAFFKTMHILDKKGLAFKLLIVGEQYKKQPAIFKKAKATLAHRIEHWGFAESFEAYAQLLWQADIAPTTSNQDFFGGSVVEAIYCDCYPLLPNRLAYPAHIPADLQATFLYENDTDFLKKLEGILIKWTAPTKHQLSSFVERYDWTHMAKVYDAFLKKIILRNVY